MYETFTQRIAEHPDYQQKYVDNLDPYTRELAFKKIFDDVALSMRKFQMEFAKRLMDDQFKQEFRNSTQRYLDR